jgi:nicotinate-nucleotide adenylyltransferase
MIGARVGVLGGTFNPIHLGHLAAARAAQATLALDRLLFVPSHAPPHRPDSLLASGYHRLQMTALAVAEVPGWQASDVELVRGGPSYTYDTLITLRTAEPASQFFFVTGADAFADIATWRHYPDLLELAHFVVIARAGTSFDHLRSRLPALAPRMVTCETTPASTRLSAPFPSIFLINAATPDVSSTEIRRRVAAGEPLDGLVPDQVVTYIAAHHLYA